MRARWTLSSCALALSSITTATATAMTAARQEPAQILPRNDYDTSFSSSTADLPSPLYSNSSMTPSTPNESVTSSDSTSITSMSRITSKSGKTPTSSEISTSSKTTSNKSSISSTSLSDTTKVTSNGPSKTDCNSNDPCVTLPTISTMTPSENSSITAPPSSSSSTSSINFSITASNCSGVVSLPRPGVKITTETITLIEEVTLTQTALNQTLTMPTMEPPLPPCSTFTSSPAFPASAMASVLELKGSTLTQTVTTTFDAQDETVTVRQRVISKVAVVITDIPPAPTFNAETTPEEQTTSPSTPPTDPDGGSGGNIPPSNQNPEHQKNEPNKNNEQKNKPPDKSQNNDQIQDNQSGQPSNHNDQNNNNPDKNQNSGNQGTGNGSPGIGGIIASILNNPFMPRPAAPAPVDNGNPSGSAQGSSPGNNQGNPAPVRPQPGQPGQPGRNIPIRIEPSAVVIGNQLVPVPSATDQTRVVVVDGQSYTVGATAVVGPSTTVPLPAGGGSLDVSPAPFVVDGVPVFVDGTNHAIISGQTYSIGPSANPTTIVVNGQTISLGPGGIGFASATLMGSDDSRTVVDGVTVGLRTSEVVISGTTYKIGPSATATAIVTNGQTISVGPGGVGFASTTLKGPDFTPAAVDGVTFGIGASQVVISGTTYNIGPSATATAIVVDGQTISVGPGGVGFASATLKGSDFTTTVVDGVTFGIGASQVVISGTTYNIGPSATPTTIVLNGETISIGPSGLGFASTTIPATGASGSRNRSPSTLPSQTGSESSAPTLSNGAVPSPNAFVGAALALLLAAVVGFVLLG